MDTLSQTSDMMLCAALALTSLVATPSSSCLLWLSAKMPADEMPADEAKPSWRPWLVLATLGVAAGVGAVLYPLSFAAPLG